MKNHSLRLAALGIGILILAGCHKLEARTNIEPNGSGELRMGVGFSAEERANLEKQNTNPQDFCNTSETPENITVTEEQRGDETWCFTTTLFQDLEALRSLYEQRKGVTINRLEISDGKFYYDIDIDTLSEDSSFSALQEITWSVTLPGAPIEHNADYMSEKTITWTPTPKSGVIHMSAVSEVHSSGINFPPCSAGWIVILVVVIQSRRRTGNSPIS